MQYAACGLVLLYVLPTFGVADGLVLGKTESHRSLGR